MRVTNLIFHIIAVILMLPDLLFIGINSLMGLGYCNNIEMIMVLTIDMIFGAAFICSTVWEIILVARYKTTRPKSYMINELIIHGLTILCFAIAVIYIIRVHLTSTYPHEYGFSMYINLAGFGLSLAGIILTLILGIRRNKKAAAVVRPQPAVPVNQSAPRPRFCPNCGKPAGVTGDFCGNCGANLRTESNEAVK